MANFWSDAFAPTSLGTGVAATTLNGGNDYSVSQKAGALIEVVPQVAETGAFTAAESLMIRSSASSNSIPTLTPKEFVGSYGLGGLSTFQVVLAPMLTARPYNTAMPYAQTPITFTGTAQIANTVAPEMSMELTLTDGGPLETEQFYIAPTNETNTGTAAGNVAGNDITINGGTFLNYLYSVLTPGVTTASESLEGRGVFTSTNYTGVPSPQRIQAQTIATGLNTPISAISPGDRWKKVHIPIGNSTLINTSFELDEALTATGNFICGVGYKKTSN